MQLPTSQQPICASRECFSCTALPSVLLFASIPAIRTDPIISQSPADCWGSTNYQLPTTNSLLVFGYFHEPTGVAPPKSDDSNYPFGLPGPGPLLHYDSCAQRGGGPVSSGLHIDPCLATLPVTTYKNNHSARLPLEDRHPWPPTRTLRILIARSRPTPTTYLLQIAYVFLCSGYILCMCYAAQKPRLQLSFRD